MATPIYISTQNQALQSIALKSSEFNHNITGVHFNSKNVLATDGHKLVVARKMPNEPENVTLKFSKAKQISNIGAESYSELNGKLIGSDPRNIAEVVEGEFPETAAVLRDPLELNYNLQISFNAEYLLQIAEVLKGNDAKVKGVTLQLRVEEGEVALLPILVSGMSQDAVGVLMPMRVDPVAQTPQALLRQITK